jgi:hypothetical protein
MDATIWGTERERYDTANLHLDASMRVVLILRGSEESAAYPHFFFVYCAE